MSFKTEIEAIVGDIDTPDLKTEANLYLVEGVKFITKALMTFPQWRNRLTQSTILTNVSPQLVMSNVLDIVSVTRKDADTSGQSRQCLEVPEFKAGQYEDVNSIYYTSKLDPKYYVANDVLSVIPEPTANQTANVKHITPDLSVAHGESTISNFPSELNRGVVLYASKELLRLFMVNRNATLRNLAPTDVSPPSAISVGTTTVGSLGNAPSYGKTTLAFDYTGPGALGVDDYLTNEDVELANIALTKHNQALQKHSNDIQDEVNEFNKELQIYQTDLQQKIQQAEISSQKEALEVQNYQSQVESYGQQVNEEMQTYQLAVQEVVQDYNWYVQQYQLVINDLLTFITQYMPPQIQGVQDEATTNG